MKLTHRQKRYADLKIEKPTESLVKIAQEAYGQENYGTARQIVNQNEKHPGITLYSNEQLSKAKQKIVQLIDSQNERIALDASRDVIDRERGKAVQQIENRTTSLSISINLTGVDTALEA